MPDPRARMRFYPGGYLRAVAISSGDPGRLRMRAWLLIIPDALLARPLTNTGCYDDVTDRKNGEGTVKQAKPVSTKEAAFAFLMVLVSFLIIGALIGGWLGVIIGFFIWAVVLGIYLGVTAIVAGKSPKAPR